MQQRKIEPHHLEGISFFATGKIVQNPMPIIPRKKIPFETLQIKLSYINPLPHPFQGGWILQMSRVTVAGLKGGKEIELEKTKERATARHLGKRREA